MTTLKQIIEIQKTIDNRQPASDTVETLENKYYYSRSRGVNIKLGNMHFDHFLRSQQKLIDEKENANLKLLNQIKELKQKNSLIGVSKNDEETKRIIKKLKKTLKSINKLVEGV